MFKTTGTPTVCLTSDQSTVASSERASFRLVKSGPFRTSGIYKVLRFHVTAVGSQQCCCLFSTCSISSSAMIKLINSLINQHNMGSVATTVTKLGCYCLTNLMYIDTASVTLCAYLV